MTSEELMDKLNQIQKLKCETQTMEIKSGEHGCPKHLYDSISSFSNQDDGGVIVLAWTRNRDTKKSGYMILRIYRKKSMNNVCRWSRSYVRCLQL